jgi:hypothetical protein
MTKPINQLKLINQANYFIGRIMRNFNRIIILHNERMILEGKLLRSFSSSNASFEDIMFYNSTKQIRLPNLDEQEERFWGEDHPWFEWNPR